MIVIRDVEMTFSERSPIGRDGSQWMNRLPSGPKRMDFLPGKSVGTKRDTETGRYKNLIVRKGRSAPGRAIPDRPEAMQKQGHLSEQGIPFRGRPGFNTRIRRRAGLEGIVEQPSIFCG